MLIPDELLDEEELELELLDEEELELEEDEPVGIEHALSSYGPADGFQAGENAL